MNCAERMASAKCAAQQQCASQTKSVLEGAPNGDLVYCFALFGTHAAERVMAANRIAARCSTAVTLRMLHPKVEPARLACAAAA